ncbi:MULTISPECIES: ROK family transcriptional regulator [Streptosporangium]|uniref:NBD/HSP70 family sugar kinase n=1 Tax=Streptosporangium brasiliense TaxID=47480 RepID=A0ABT9QZY0_9ACTN|nr:ROK family transcriptional regulator [Streptosporangium brasiliense]MDP9862526.1 putative NBD/HSP70 family sugar kinase [Streptosporangium brasiliense]
MRQLNSLASLHALRGSPPLTLAELARRTGLSRASINEVMADLMDRGWVAEVPPASGAMGRPARRYRFRSDAGYVLGLDIGVDKVRAAITDLNGEVIAGGRTAVGAETPRQERLDAVDRAIAACLAMSNVPVADIWAITAGTVGVVDLEGRVTTVYAIPDWAGVDLPGHLGRTFGQPVLVANDSKLAALAEQRLGVAREVRDLVYLHAGRRPGAAMIVDGKLHRGFSGASGEVGLLDAVRWIHMAEHLERCPGFAGHPPDQIAGLVFEAARAGDPAALDAVGRYVADLAIGAAALILTLDPELVVLGGGFSRSGDVLLQPLRRALEPLCLRMPEIRLSSLGEDSVVLGAACLAIDHVNRLLLSADDPLLALSAPRAVT